MTKHQQRSSRMASVEDAVAAIARGEIVVVVDDEDRENEGDLIMAAEFATPEKIAFFVKHTSGVICMPLTGERWRKTVRETWETSAPGWGKWEPTILYSLSALHIPLVRALRRVG